MAKKGNQVYEFTYQDGGKTVKNTGRGVDEASALQDITSRVSALRKGGSAGKGTLLGQRVETLTKTPGKRSNTYSIAPVGESSAQRVVDKRTPQDILAESKRSMDFKSAGGLGVADVDEETGNISTRQGMAPATPMAVDQTETPTSNEVITDTYGTGNQYRPNAAGVYEAVSPERQGFEAAKASGQQAPQTAPEARMGAAQYTPNAPSAASQANVEALFAEDPIIKSITDTFNDLMSPPKQSQSLVSEYKKALKESGLNDINEELIDTQRIIEGTEDDIRAEVTAAGGFATDSQVLAMSVGRNKSLLKNYNALLATRDSIQQNLQMMMQLSQQDRQMANERFGQQMQFGQMILNYKDKMMNNAREGYNNVINAIGYDGLYSSLQNDPYTLSLAEKTLGLGSGQLSQAAVVAQQRRAREEYMDDLDIESKQLDIQQKRADLAGGGTGTLNGKPQSVTQATAQGYADRLAQANIVVSELGSSFTGNLAFGGSLPSSFQSDDRQAYEQSKQNFITAVLRRESGAAISDGEFDREEQKYFPQRGDGSKVIQQKEAARQTAINNLYREANVQRTPMPGEIVESNGKQYRVESDGETLTEI